MRAGFAAISGTKRSGVTPRFTTASLYMAGYSVWIPESPSGAAKMFSYPASLLSTV